MGGFDWDEENLTHIARHGVEADEAEQVVADAVVLGKEERAGELRYRLVGETSKGRVLVVVVTLVGDLSGVEWPRVITAWDADKKLRRYWRAFQRRQSDGGENNG